MLVSTVETQIVSFNYCEPVWGSFSLNTQSKFFKFDKISLNVCILDIVIIYIHIWYSQMRMVAIWQCELNHVATNLETQRNV